MNLWYISLLLCVLITSGCSNQNTSTIASVHDHSSNADQEKKPKLEVEVKTSGKQAAVEIKTDLKISKEHYGKEKVAGEGHIHMYLDNGEKQGVTDITNVLTGLTPGIHTLKVSLHNNDHTPYDVQRTVEFEIK
ncbi:hypothetical protein [Effusibacillus consociatus]|uniref:DUF4399 domain-containing protein n=1 Tax=Effusibacillus consociatus TaxID=1117041 RepID=A0ABV9Q268_9BACL